jgi:hypothetical protein
VHLSTGEVETINGYAVVNSDSGEGKLGVYFPSVGMFAVSRVQTPPKKYVVFFYRF